MPVISDRCGISVLGNSARIDVSDKESKYPSVNVTDENAPIAQVAAYLATKDMYLCHNPEKYISIVNDVDNDSSEALIYDIQGRRIEQIQKGFNIIRKSDSKAQKVVANMGRPRTM